MELNYNTTVSPLSFDIKKNHEEMSKWAKEEVEKANAAYGIPSDTLFQATFDIVLNAYNYILKECEDMGHWRTVRRMLARLMDDKPLTDITEGDFEGAEELNAPDNAVSVKRCPRYPSLIRTEYKDGTIRYSDEERYYYWDDNNNEPLRGIDLDIIDEYIPITLPYRPPTLPSEIHVSVSLSNPKNGDYDTVHVSHIQCECDRIDVDRYWIEIDGVLVEIDKDKFEDISNKRQLACNSTRNNSERY